MISRRLARPVNAKPSPPGGPPIPRMKRMGRNFGYTPSYKKAIVTLTEGSKTIEFFDTML